MYKIGDIVHLKTKEQLIKDKVSLELIDRIANYGFPFGTSQKIIELGKWGEIKVTNYGLTFEPKNRICSGYKNMKEKRAMGLAV